MSNAWYWYWRVFPLVDTNDDGCRVCNISHYLILSFSKHCSTSCSVYSDNRPGKTSQYIYAISAIASVHRARRDDLHHWLCPAHPLRLDLQTRSDIYINISYLYGVFRVIDALTLTACTVQVATSCVLVARCLALQTPTMQLSCVY